MSVDVIQKNNTQISRVSYLSSLAAGGIVGYSMKYLIPITKSEKDERYKSAVEKINRDSILERQGVLDQFEKSTTREDVLAAYKDLKQKNKFNPLEISKYEEKISSSLFDLNASANERAAKFISNKHRILKADIKSLRPGGVFVAIGAVAAFVSAFIHNLKTIRKGSN